MDPTPTQPAETRGHVVHSEAVWDYARRDYLDGQAAGAVCARYGIARSTFWDRAASEGWRRCDQPPPALPPIRFEDDDGQDMSYGQMHEIAQLRLSEAIRRGRSTEVSSWLRVVAQLKKPYREELEFMREAHEWEAARRPKPDSPDSSD